VAVRRRAGPGLAHARIEAQVADQLARALEAVDVADRCQQAGGDDHVHAGHAHQPPDLRRLKRVACDQALDCGDLRVEELDLAHAAVDRLALLERQLQRGEPCAALDTEQIRERRTAHPAGASAPRGSRSSRASAP
jgi:hypothetical protein